MNRRAFLRRLGVAVVGLTLARTLPGIASVTPAIAFRSDAFVAAFDWSEMAPVRMDVIYGWGVTRNLAVRVEGA